ncbi:MAG TPA: hypothetical protein VFP95_02995, partial [Gammaproteobacteria bacterium]|nr:hypothetical protein [Gammaproteobacteria bacterium]
MTTRERSTFVSVIAWVFIVFSSLGAFFMAMEALIFFLLPFEELAAQSAQSSAQPMPTVVFSFMRGFIIFLVLVCLWSLASSIGLLLRKNWGRINFIIIMAIGVFFQILGVLWSFVFVFAGAFMPEQAANGVDVSFM